MKAIIFEQTGGPDVFKTADVPTPEPKPNEVLVKLHAAGVNHLDIWVRTGSPAYPVPLPHILGSDGAGVVEALGADSEGVSVGDRVMLIPGIFCGHCRYCKAGLDNQCDTFEILGAKRRGTYAEYVAVPDQNVVAIPDNVSFEQAAALPVAYVTAWHMLMTRAKLTAGETFFVVGAGAGVSIAAMQIARRQKARVLAVTTGASKVERIKKAGAHDVLVWDGKDDFSAWVKKQTDGRGAEVVMDHVGPATWEHSFKSAAKYGRIVTCGSTTGPSVPLDLRSLFARNISLLGSRFGAQKDIRDLTAAVFRGEITPDIDLVLPLGQAADAHRRMESKEQTGKIVLRI